MPPAGLRCAAHLVRVARRCHVACGCLNASRQNYFIPKVSTGSIIFLALVNSKMVFSSLEMIKSCCNPIFSSSNNLSLYGSFHKPRRKYGSRVTAEEEQQIIKEASQTLKPGDNERRLGFCNMELEERFRPTCSSLQKISFGLGHVFNDLCAAMWFSYTLFYLQVVLSIPSTTAGTLLMIGQVVDSLATPAAGWAIDYTDRRRGWHFGGTVAVAVGFFLMFSLKPTNLTTLVLVYYILSITLFQVGWAIVQISHLSIIPKISRSHSHSSDLTAIRYTASVCCSITVYVITLIILGTNDTAVIGPNDFYKFKEISLIILFVGILASLLFYCGLLGTEENEYEIIREVDDVNHLNTNNGKHFLRQSIIYLVALMYMTSRLFTILNLIYIPLYLDERGEIELVAKEKIRQTIASIPLVSYTASFLTSLLLKCRVSSCSDKVTYFCGGLVGLSASIWLGSGVSPSSDVELYFIAIFLGVSGSSTMVASLCLTANFVKANGYGGGLIYSIVTFTDKLISGGVVLLVQNLQCTPKTLCPHYYEHVLSYICGIVSLIGVVSLALLQWEIKRNVRRH